MSGALLAGPVAAPLLTAGLLIALPDLPLLRRIAGATISVGVLLAGVALLAASHSGRVVTQNVGGWPAGFAIVLAADTLSALMVCASALLVLIALAFAAATGDDAHPLFTPLALILSAGVYGALLTADLFNLFVFVEVMLVPSYALLTMTGGRERVAAGRIYLAVNLLASTIFLAGIALLYGLTGSVNLGELAGAARHVTVALAGGVVLVAMAVKAAIVPLHGWLPRTYPNAPPAVTVLFSGLLTKVGVYAIFRVYAVVFDGTPSYRWVIMAAALLTMVVGVLGAVGEQTMRGVLSFHMVSQIGYLLVGLALFNTIGLAAAIFFLVQYILVKAALLACAGAVETTYGTGRLDRLGGLAARDPALACAFMFAALSLAGLPPLSGFVAKLSLLRAAAIDASYAAVAVAVAVSLFTLLSMIKIWSAVFWGKPNLAVTPTLGRANVRPLLAGPALALAAPSLLLGIAAQPLLTLATAAAGGLIDTAPYVQAVTR
jgi:multicomponent Na+:H+ antiporter subunit D